MRQHPFTIEAVDVALKVDERRHDPLAVNGEAVEAPATIGADTWLVQILPVNLDTELQMLLKD